MAKDYLAAIIGFLFSEVVVGVCVGFGVENALGTRIQSRGPK